MTKQIKIMFGDTGPNIEEAVNKWISTHSFPILTIKVTHIVSNYTNLMAVIIYEREK